ncbi:MAG: hypothetical protein HY328_14225 [Chloroflexi bacterium]|nr:hypothetical protein [Chloroflexota bacterium]
MPVQFETPVLPTRDSETVSVHITNIQITPARARQLVGIHTGNTIGDLVAGDTPNELVIAANRAYWRVPVLLFGGLRGRIGQIGYVDVDSETGDLKLTDALQRKLEDDALRLAASAAL